MRQPTVEPFTNAISRSHLQQEYITRNQGESGIVNRTIGAIYSRHLRARIVGYDGLSILLFDATTV